MATLTAAASFAGNGVVNGPVASLRLAAGATWFGSGSVRMATTQKFTLQAAAQVFAGKGLLDSWRVSNFSEYDPAALFGRNMRLRKARLSTEGIFGDD